LRRKYFALRLIAGVFKVLAWLAIVVGIVAFILTIVSGGMFFNTMGSYGGLLMHIPMAILSLFIGFVVFIGWYALAESILVFLDIEENTRRCAQLLAKGE
jgi:hypothetical protein